MSTTKPDTETGWSNNVNQLARNIIERISDAAIELMIARHELYDDDGEELEKEAIVLMKSDVVACMTGDDPGCNDPDELDESNCELLWLQSVLARPSAVAWSDEFPEVEETFYWVRHKQNHADLNVGLLRDRTLLLAEGGSMSKSTRKDFEFLPASPSDFEQLIRLRKAAGDLLAAMDQLPMRFGSTEQSVTALREALGHTGGKS